MPKQKKRKYGDYIEFLETRLNSKNFLANATAEEIAETKRKYKKEKLVRKLLGKRKK